MVSRGTQPVDNRSRTRLQGVHPDLVRVIDLASTRASFIVTEGLRTKERQAELFKAGASKTMNSRHLTGHAVDLAAKVGKEVRWDWSCYLILAGVVKTAAEELNIPIRWGGTWGLLSDLNLPITADVLHKKFPDGPHFELPAKEYP